MERCHTGAQLAALAFFATQKAKKHCLAYIFATPVARHVPAFCTGRGGGPTIKARLREILSSFARPGQHHPSAMPLPTTSAVERNLRLLNSKLLERLRAAEEAAAEEKAAREEAEKARNIAEQEASEARAKANLEEQKRKKAEAGSFETQGKVADPRVTEVSYSTIGTGSSTVETSKIGAVSPQSEASVSARSEERKGTWERVVQWWWEVVHDVLAWLKSLCAGLFRKRDEQQPLLAGNV